MIDLKTPHGLLEAATTDADAPHLIGMDPRNLTPADFAAAEVPLMLAKEAIRSKCLDCCGGSVGEVRKCVAVACALWPFRMTGRLPQALKQAALLATHVTSEAAE